MIAMKQRAAAETQGTEQEDPYGRCTNMRLTSFTDKTGAGGQGVASVPRDPRLIDLSQSAASTGNLGQHTGNMTNVPCSNMGNGGSAGPVAGGPGVVSQAQYMSNFNTLPAHMTQQHQVS